MGYILSLDQGTTGSTAALIDDQSFTLLPTQNFEFPQHFPEPGLVEHDLNQIWESMQKAVEAVLVKNSVTKDQITAIGITNQRETTCCFDKQGNPLAHAIVWQDRRTVDFCNQLKAAGHLDYIKQTTGLPLDPYFSATKMNWLKNNNENVKNHLANDNALFGTIDTFILYKLTQGESYKTDATNASRTMLMNLENAQWDEKLLGLFDIDPKNLPSIHTSFEEFGKTKNLTFLPDGIPISGILGDQQSALFGQAGYRPHSMKCTYGTGAFMLFNTGTEKIVSKNGLLTTVAYKHNEQIFYALEGSCYIAGAAIQWLRDNLSIINTAKESEDLARLVTDLNEMKELLFLPFFTGIGSPYWKPDAKAAIIGITRGTQKSHMARATLDGIALSINDLKVAMEKDINQKIKTLKVDGGATFNNLLMEIQASVSNCKIIRPKIIETTAYGAALAAGIGSDLINFDQIEKLWQQDRAFDQDDDLLSFYSDKLLQWKEIISKLFNSH